MKSLIKITLIFFLFLKLSYGIKKVRYRKISGRTGGGRSQNDLYGFLNRISPPRDVATLFDLAEYEDDYVPVTPSYTTPRPPTTTTRCPNKFWMGLKISEKVSFNIASEASYVYSLRGPKH